MSGLPATIFRLWIHSHEEDSEPFKIYRTADYDFPPARGRTGFEIKKDGEFMLYGIGPDDRSERRAGRWRATGKDSIKVSFADGAAAPLEVHIISCDGETLKLKREEL